MDKNVKDYFDKSERLLLAMNALVEEIESEITRLYDIQNENPIYKAQLRLLYHLSSYYDDILNGGK